MALDAWGRPCCPECADRASTGADTSGGSTSVAEAALMAGGAVGLLAGVLGAPLWGALLIGAAGAGMTKLGIDRVTGA